MARIARLAILATVLFATPGCVLFATLFGIGVVQGAVQGYKNGIGVQDFESSLEETWQACLDEMEEHHAIITEDPKLNRIKGSRIELKAGWVEIMPHPKMAGFTRVRARFAGAKGGNAESRKWAFTLLDGIDARLGGTGSPSD